MHFPLAAVLVCLGVVTIVCLSVCLYLFVATCCHLSHIPRQEKKTLYLNLGESGKNSWAQIL